jgi:hypothetical protein
MISRARLGRACRGAVAGAIAAGVWSAVEPLAAEAFDSKFTDVAMLGRWVAPDGPWRPIGLAMHITNGAAFGAAFGLLGGRGLRAGVGAAMAEYVVSWPAMAVADRVHPDRIAERLPRLLTSGRIAGQEAAMHLLFGAVLGAVADALEGAASEGEPPGDLERGANIAM